MKNTSTVRNRFVCKGKQIQFDYSDHTWVNGFRMKRAMMVVGGNFDRPVYSSGFGSSLAGLPKGPHQTLHSGDHRLRRAFPKKYIDIRVIQEPNLELN